jgi:hypothetical protein
MVGTANKVGYQLKYYIGPLGSASATPSPEDYVSYDGSAERTMNINPYSIGAATSDQGSKADTAVQEVQINDTPYPTVGGVVNLPPYPEVINKATGIILSNDYAASPTPEPTSGESVESAIQYLHYTQGTKVDKVAGKGLSTNDYTTADKDKLAGIAKGATANTGTVTEVIVGAGLKVTGGATGSKITTKGTIEVITDDTPTSGSSNLMTSDALYQFTQGLVPKTQQATHDTLGLIKLGSDT